MRFIDEARIEVSAGRGGPGAVSFLREKFRPKGPPSGGDGGRGGNVYVRVEPSMSSLLDYKFRQHFWAKNGEAGSSCDCAGHDAEDLILKVPPGTLIYDDESNQLIQDLWETKEPLLLARGGRGGKGNAHFASSTQQSPRFAQPGEEGEEMIIRLELKLLADVGLVGLPNAGKSSFLSAVTAARPKVANYPFTTLNPQLGVVHGPERMTYVMADIPGLIENASQGAGLGQEFLRHVERSRLLLHLIDVSELAMETPDRAYELVTKELSLNRVNLADRARWVVLTKTDAVTPDVVDKWTDTFRKQGREVFAVSAAGRQGLEPLINKTFAWVDQARKEDPTWARR